MKPEPRTKPDFLRLQQAFGLKINFFIRINFTGTEGLKLVKNQNKLKTFWDRKVQKLNIKITMIYICF